MKNGEVEFLATKEEVKDGTVGISNLFKVWQVQRGLKGNYLSSTVVCKSRGILLRMPSRYEIYFILTEVSRFLKVSDELGQSGPQPLFMRRRQSQHK